MNNFNFFFLFHWHTFLDYMYELKEARRKIKKKIVLHYEHFFFVLLSSLMFIEEKKNLILFEISM